MRINFFTSFLYFLLGFLWISNPTNMPKHKPTEIPMHNQKVKSFWMVPTIIPIKEPNINPIHIPIVI